MSATLPRTIASAWWEQGNTRALVLIMTSLAALDSVYTAIWIGERGLIGEANPLIKSLFEVGLGPVWGILNVFVTFLGAVFLGSCVVALEGRGRAYPVLGMSLLATLKVVLALYHLIQAYHILSFAWMLWLAGAVTFVTTRELLNKGRLFDWDHAAHVVSQLRNDLSTFVIFSRAPKTRPVSADLEPIHSPKPRGQRPSVLRDRRLFFWLGVIVLAPILGLSVVELLLRMSGVLDLPSWMRRIGMVSEQQGRLFLIALVTILLTIALLIYSIVAVFEIFSSETTRKKHRTRKRDEQNRLIGVPIVLLFLVSCWTIIPADAFATSNVDAAPLSNDFFGALPEVATPPEVAAVVDSKGTVHAAWVEYDEQVAASGRATLWYATYDPDYAIPKSMRSLDTYDHIYSLGMAVGNLDEIHMVWVRQAASMTVTPDGPKIAVDELYYLSMYPNGTVIRTPERLLGPRTDEIWASITFGRGTGLYLAWTEASQEAAEGVEWATYYSRVNADDAVNDSSGLLVARGTGSARMIRASLSADDNDLHLAWVQDIPANTCRIMYSNVNLSGNTIETIKVEDVNGTITRLALATTGGGQVVMGWAYQDSRQDEQIAGVTRISREGGTESKWIETPSRRLAQLESMAIDSQGNLHILWADLSEDTRAAPKSIPASRASFYYAKYASDGRSTEEKQETIYLPTLAAFVLGNGQLYVVSRTGMLEIVRPSLVVDSITVAVALLAFASAASAISTEPGAYLVARTMKPLIRRGSNGLRTKILRKVRGHPGITLSDLKTLTHGNILEVASHLRMLESSGLIHSLRDGARQRFYRITPDEPAVPQMGETRRAIISLVERDPGMTEGQIARTLGMSQQLTNYHLRLLSNAKLISRHQDGGKISYYLDKRYSRRVYGSAG